VLKPLCSKSFGRIQNSKLPHRCAELAVDMQMSRVGHREGWSQVRGLDVCREVGVSTAVWWGMAQKRMLVAPKVRGWQETPGWLPMGPCRKTSKINALQKQFERY